MIPSLLVKAEVVDIRNRKSNLPKRVVADANVLYVINYDFTGLAASGGRVEPRRSLRRGAVSVVSGLGGRPRAADGLPFTTWGKLARIRRFSMIPRDAESMGAEDGAPPSRILQEPARSGDSLLQSAE